MIAMKEAIKKLDNYISKHGDKTASVEEINKILEGIEDEHC